MENLKGEKRTNNQKVSFITCVNNNKEYRTSLHYIHSLMIPYGFEIETIAIKNAISLTSGYNRAMNRSDAKYKVYLHQDTCILHRFPNPLEVISLLERYPDLGMLWRNRSKNNTGWGLVEQF